MPVAGIDHLRDLKSLPLAARAAAVLAGTIATLWLGATSDGAPPKAVANAAPALKQVGTIPLGGVRGRIDHMSADVSGKRLFVAALGNNTVEVVNLSSAKVTRSLTGVKAPQGVLYLPSVNRLVVACRDDGSIRIYDGSTLTPVTVINKLNDADNLRYDSRHKAIVAGYGDGAIGFFDEKTYKQLGEVRLDGHPESFQIEKNGNRMFVNTPTSSSVQVIDTDTKRVVRTWPLSNSGNFAMAFNEDDARLYIAARRPPRLATIDSVTGVVVDDRLTIGDIDDVFFDAAHRRLYITGGEGAIDVVRLVNKNKLEPVINVPTRSGARTSLFVPEWGRLFVAVPASDGRPAEIRVFAAE